MYELINAGKRTWYMKAPTNTGFFLCGSQEVCMIDAGGDRTAAAKALEHINSQGWRLIKLFLTHSHSDHVGGAAYLQEHTGCEVYAPGISAAAVRHSFLIAATLYGGRPADEMCGKLLLPPACDCLELTDSALPQGLEYLRLDGHDMAQAVFRTADKVWFTADCVISEEALQKHRISFLYNIGQHLQSLETLSGLSGKLFIPSHNEPCRDIRPLVEINRAAVLEVAADIREMCRVPLTIDELIENALEKYGIRLYLLQYLLVGETVRCYISWLMERGDIRPVFSGTKLLWQISESDPQQNHCQH